MNKEVYIKFRGRVQGIGFRWWAVKKAREIGGNSGWVRNVVIVSVFIMKTAEEDKIEKSGVHVTPSKYVDAPIIEEYPLTLECTVESFEDGNLIGNVVNVSIDEDYLDENGKIDVDKMEIIAFDMVNNTYRVLGENVGKAFKDGFDL